jgi:hypothetical protein
MINRAPRNASLLSQISKTNPFLERAQAVFGIGNSYDRDLEAIAEDRRLSAEGKREKAKVRRQEALRALNDAQKAVDDHRKQSESMRAGMKAPSYDKADNYAAGLRRELRDASRAMTPGQRAAKLSGPTRSTAFIDALLEFEGDPWMSGVDVFNPNELEIFEAAKQSRLRELNGPLLDALEARASTEAEILMVLNIVRNDIAGDGNFQAEIQATRDAYIAAATG